MRKDSAELISKPNAGKHAAVTARTQWHARMPSTIVRIQWQSET